MNFPGIVKTSKKPSLSLVDHTKKDCVYSFLKAELYHCNCDGLIWWWCECALMRVLAGSITPPCIIHQPSYQQRNHLKYYETTCSDQCFYKSKDISILNQGHTWSFSWAPQAVLVKMLNDIFWWTKLSQNSCKQLILGMCGGWLMNWTFTILWLSVWNKSAWKSM